MRIARILSVWPTNFAMRFPERGSHILITRSGDPEATTDPYGSVASAYIDAFGPAASGGWRTMSGSAFADAVARSHNLIVRSNDPEANHCCSRLHNVSH